MTVGRNEVIMDDRTDLCGKTLGDYQILKRIGGGATSDVFLARQISLERHVALKILKDALASDDNYVRRFLHEARAAAQLEHPNVVRIYEVGELKNPEPSSWLKLGKNRRESAKSYWFISQEFISGVSLAQFLRRNGPASIQQTFVVLEQVAAALKCASDFNLVHRDVKPENILVDSSGIIRVVDFGLARAIGPTESTMTGAYATRTGVALGTPLYMSPEQARGQTVDARSDVYSLGVTAYQLLTGRAPFNGATPLAVALKHINERPTSVSELRPEVPEGLANLVMRMLEKNAADRPASLSELINDIRAARRECQGAFSRAESSLKEAVLDEESGVSTFFSTDEERERYDRVATTTSLALDWRATYDQLESVKREGVVFWNRRRVAFFAVFLVASFLLGGLLHIINNRRLSFAPPEPPLCVERFRTVEEQYVFALQTGAVDAWKSVYEYFPGVDYWEVRAKKQLALVYVSENDVESAGRLFQELGGRTKSDVAVETFVLAGRSWLEAQRGNYSAAVSLLSELTVKPNLDHMTQYLVAKTRGIIQKRYEIDFRSAPVNDARQFETPTPYRPQYPRAKGAESGMARFRGGRQNDQTEDRSVKTP